MLYYGLEWHSLDSYFQLKELSAAPGTPPVSEVRLYAKDKSSVSHLYWMGDDGTEHDLGGNLFGSGTANRLAYWSSSNTLAANAALTATRVPFADANGLLTDDSDMTFSTDTLTVTKARVTNLGAGVAPGAMPLLVQAADGATIFQFEANSGTQHIALNAIENTGDVSILFRVGSPGSRVPVFNIADDFHINIDSDNDSSDRAFRIKKDVALRVGGSILLEVNESGIHTMNDVLSVATGFRVAGAATSGNVLRGNGTNFVSAQLDHGDLAGNSDDDHTGYALLAGRSGGQTLKGGTASGDDLTLMSTNHATKGSIIMGSSEYDEVNGVFRVTGQNRFRYLNSMASLKRSNFQTLSNDTVTVIGFDQEEVDTDGLHSTVTDNSKVTIAVTGKYFVFGQIDYEDNATGMRQARIHKNGSEFLTSLTSWTVVTGVPTIVQVASLMSLSAGDYVELAGYQNSGGDLDVNFNVGNAPTTRFAVIYVGE